MNGWRSRAKNAIRRYPELCRAEKEIHSGKVTLAYSGMPMGGDTSRTTELIAMRQLPRNDQRDLDAVRATLDTIHRQCKNANLRLKMVDIVYWRRTHSVDGASMILHIAPSTAHSWDRELIKLVDAYRMIY